MNKKIIYKKPELFKPSETDKLRIAKIITEKLSKDKCVVVNGHKIRGTFN